LPLSKSLSNDFVMSFSAIMGSGIYIMTKFKKSILFLFPI